MEYLLTGLKEEVEENETLTEQISQLKQKNSEGNQNPSMCAFINMYFREKEAQWYQ